MSRCLSEEFDMPTIEPPEDQDNKVEYWEVQGGCSRGPCLYIFLGVLIFWLVVAWLISKLYGHIPQPGKIISAAFPVVVLAVIAARTWLMWQSSQRTDIRSGLLALASFIGIVMIVAMTVANW